MVNKILKGLVLFLIGYATIFCGTTIYFMASGGLEWWRSTCGPYLFVVIPLVALLAIFLFLQNAHEFKQKKPKNCSPDKKTCDIFV